MIVQHSQDVSRLIDALIQAKEKGLIDHRESRDILTKVLGEIGYNLAQRPSGPGGSATR